MIINGYAAPTVRPAWGWNTDCLLWGISFCSLSRLSSGEKEKQKKWAVILQSGTASVSLPTAELMKLVQTLYYHFWNLKIEDEIGLWYCCCCISCTLGIWRGYETTFTSTLLDDFTSPRVQTLKRGLQYGFSSFGSIWYDFLYGLTVYIVFHWCSNSIQPQV